MLIKCIQCKTSDFLEESAANHYGLTYDNHICMHCTAYNKKEVGDIYQEGNDYKQKQPTVHQYKELKDQNKFMEAKLNSLGYCRHGVFINSYCSSCIVAGHKIQPVEGE